MKTKYGKGKASNQTIFTIVFYKFMGSYVFLGFGFIFLEGGGCLNPLNTLPSLGYEPRLGYCDLMPTSMVPLIGCCVGKSQIMTKGHSSTNFDSHSTLNTLIKGEYHICFPYKRSKKKLWAVLEGTGLEN